MTSTLAPTTIRHAPGVAERFGYTVAIVLNGALLWFAHELLDLGWPGFLTERWELVLPVLTASLIAGIVANAAFVVHDRGRFRALADLVTGALSLAVSIRTWNVFPFDFSGYGTDWSWALRAILVLAIVGTSVAVIVNTVKLVFGPGRDG